MNVSLTPELEKFIAAKVLSGRYNSASEVIRETLRLLEGQDEARASQLAGFNRELGRRLAALDRAEHVDPAAARAKLKRKSDDHRQRVSILLSEIAWPGPGRFSSAMPAYADYPHPER